MSALFAEKAATWSAAMVVLTQFIQSVGIRIVPAPRIPSFNKTHGTVKNASFGMHPKTRQTAGLPAGATCSPLRTLLSQAKSV